MKRNKEFANRLHALSPRFAYIPPEDRFLMHPGPLKYRFNVIGAGVNGQEHIAVTQLEGRCTVHGVYDPNPSSVEGARRVKARFTDEPLVVYESLEAACFDPAVDALIISTPNHTHLEVLRVAVESGKHILLEKPMATNIPDAYQVWQMAQNYPKVLQIGLQYRYKPIYVEALHEVKVRRSIGEVKTLSIVEHREPFLDKVGQWNKFSCYSGGTLVEKCCHYFDLLNLFAGARPVSVYAVGSQAVNFKDFEYRGKKSDILDNAFVILEYPNGVRASFNLCMFVPMFYEEIVVCGDEGRLRAWEGVNGQAYSRWAHYLEVICLPDRTSRTTTPSYPAFIEETGHSGATYYEHLRFIEALDGKPSGAASAEEGFWSVVVGVAAEESIRRGEKVSIAALLAEHGLGHLA
ncbi:gfo/Idh/MocA family oxidoreductase [Meiothermus sp. QL-1]|uniref:Gfo/Idh/MocA family protein n=1 Tax=Meiothermus sp. QL-1 TaxID=2058095 RepID=UPI000E0C8D4B|nr:Gfo/Idh/MocA family oxidoreductase [Meiothermus sp. QL-1]RDI96053.1 gfo/Idh/MocA family oxidoreductase [Meiothermus sp. QL-1]